MAHRIFELSALATEAVPGLVIVEAAEAPGESEDFDTALLRDGEGRLLLARRPRTDDAARAQRSELRAIAALSDGVRSRLPFRAPRLVGAAGEDAVVVLEYLPGSTPIEAELAPGSALLPELGQAIAAVHGLPREFATAAALPQSSAVEAREAADDLVEQAKGTGRLPVTLERRWLAAIDDPSLWQFQPCVSHGGIDLESFRSVDSRLEAVVDWRDLRIGDPARDLGWVTALPHDAADAIVEAYVEARGASVDRQLRQRASLYAELGLASWLRHAVSLDDGELVEDAERLLDDLVGRVRAAESKPLVHETLPVLDLEEVRSLLKDSKAVRARSVGAPPSDGPATARQADDDFGVDRGGEIGAGGPASGGPDDAADELSSAFLRTDVAPEDRAR